MARAGSADLPDGESGIFFAGRAGQVLVICPSGIDCPALSELTDVPFSSDQHFVPSFSFHTA